MASFGGIEPIKEAARDVRGTRWLEDLSQDLRYAARAMRRHPAFAVAAVCLSSRGQAQVAFDAASNASPATVSTANPVAVSWNHTVGLARKPYIAVSPHGS